MHFLKIRRTLPVSLDLTHKLANLQGLDIRVDVCAGMPIDMRIDMRIYMHIGRFRDTILPRRSPTSHAYIVMACEVMA